MMMISAAASSFSELPSIVKKLLPFLNLRFLNLSILVLLLSSLYLVDRNSHDLIQKKNARIRSWTIAISQFESAVLCICLRTDAGIAFCLFLPLSLFL